ncbi:MAG: hypothetical protein RO257_12985 [Candidatus Kapabacteria bacterium]|nr:hypothetical protein [Candidatus Kapabacteria bacterium]
MKKIYLLILAAFLTFSFGCKKVENPTNENSPWLERLIEHFENSTVGDPPQSIWQYEYNGDIVYYIPPQCCDQFSVLLSSDSTVICAPDGGIAAMGDGRCDDFFQKCKDKKLIWQDDRK